MEKSFENWYFSVPVRDQLQNIKHISKILKCILHRQRLLLNAYFARKLTFWHFVILLSTRTINHLKDQMTTIAKKVVFTMPNGLAFWLKWQKKNTFSSMLKRTRRNVIIWSTTSINILFAKDATMVLVLQRIELN